MKNMKRIYCEYCAIATGIIFLAREIYCRAMLKKIRKKRSK